MLSRNKKKPPYAFILLIIFFLPALISWGLYYFHDDFQFKTTNHGTLINPVVSLENVPLNKGGKHIWQIVYAPKECEGVLYEKTTFILHQLQLALGENRKRVRLSLMMNELCHPKDMHDFQSLSLNAQQTELLQKALGSSEITNKIYLLDPLGNLFMYYSGDANPMFILKDMKKVLEVSQIG